MGAKTKQRVDRALGELLEQATGHLDRIQQALPEAPAERRERVLLWLSDVMEDLDTVADLAEGLGEDRCPRRG